MSQQTLLILSAVLVVLSLTIAVVAWVSSMRWMREYRASMDQAVRAKDDAIRSREEQIETGKESLTSLKKEVTFLKELDSVRFAQRYLATKNALEQRLNRLSTHRARWRDRAREVQRRLDELSLSREQKASELAALRSELAKTLHDTRTLEQALQAVSTLGAIPVADLQAALSRRRRKQAEISQRLEQLGLEGEDKVSEIERLGQEMEKAGAESERLEREIEITRAAGPLLDSLLGVTSELRDRMGTIEDQLDESMRSLSAFRGSSQIAEFLRAAAHATREPAKLLGAGVVAEAVAEKVPEPPAERRQDWDNGAPMEPERFSVPPVDDPEGLDIVFGSSLRSAVHANGE
jgi:chromosome segregation ATPase